MFKHSLLTAAFAGVLISGASLAVGAGFNAKRQCCASVAGTRIGRGTASP